MQGAIITFTKGASADLAGRKIRVNSIAPGPVWTPLIVQSFPDEVVRPLPEFTVGTADRAT